MKKKNPTVPISCRIKRFIKKISRMCIKIKTDISFGFSRDKDTVPEKTHSIGTEKTVSMKSIIIAAGAVCALICTAAIAAKLTFEIAVLRTSKKRRR